MTVRGQPWKTGGLSKSQCQCRPASFPPLPTALGKRKSSVSHIPTAPTVFKLQRGHSNRAKEGDILIELAQSPNAWLDFPPLRGYNSSQENVSPQTAKFRLFRVL